MNPREQGRRLAVGLAWLAGLLVWLTLLGAAGYVVAQVLAGPLTHVGAALAGFALELAAALLAGHLLTAKLRVPRSVWIILAVLTAFGVVIQLLSGGLVLFMELFGSDVVPHVTTAMGGPPNAFTLVVAVLRDNGAYLVSAVAAYGMWRTQRAPGQAMHPLRRRRWLVALAALAAVALILAGTWWDARMAYDLTDAGVSMKVLKSGQSVAIVNGWGTASVPKGWTGQANAYQQALPAWTGVPDGPPGDLRQVITLVPSKQTSVSPFIGIEVVAAKKTWIAQLKQISHDASATALALPSGVLTGCAAKAYASRDPGADGGTMFVHIFLPDPKAPAVIIMDLPWTRWPPTAHTIAGYLTPFHLRPAVR